MGDVSKFARAMLRPPCREVTVEDVEDVLPERMFDIVDELPERLEEGPHCVPDFYPCLGLWSFDAPFTV